MTRGQNLIAPEVLFFEIGNALSSLFKKNILETEQMYTVWDTTQKIPVEIIEIDIKSSLTIAAEHMIYAYDAYFLNCALKTNSPLLTLDKGLKHVAHQLGIKTLGD